MSESVALNRVKRERAAEMSSRGGPGHTAPSALTAGVGNQAMLAMLRTGGVSSGQSQTAPRQSEGVPLADAMRAKFEQRFRLPMDDVRVHWDSDEPAKFDAGAFTYGRDIYIGPAQEDLLDHEMTHEAQQKMGQARPTGMENGMAVNRSPALEHSASLGTAPQTVGTAAEPVVQCGPGLWDQALGCLKEFFSSLFACGSDCETSSSSDLEPFLLTGDPDGGTSSSSDLEPFFLTGNPDDETSSSNDLEPFFGGSGLPPLDAGDTYSDDEDISPDPGIWSPYVGVQSLSSGEPPFGSGTTFTGAETVPTGGVPSDVRARNLQITANREEKRRQIKQQGKKTKKLSGKTRARQNEKAQQKESNARSKKKRAERDTETPPKPVPQKIVIGASARRQLKKMPDRERELFEEAIEEVRQGDGGRNTHRLRGSLQGMTACDVRMPKGSGPKGRGTTRLLTKSKGGVTYVDTSSKHYKEQRRRKK